jgi:hypothetical protein
MVPENEIIVNRFIIIFSTHSNEARGFECGLRKSHDRKELGEH